MRQALMAFCRLIMLTMLVLSPAAAHAVYQVSEVAPVWDGTDANRLKIPTLDYDHTYGDESVFRYTLPWTFYYNGTGFNSIYLDSNGSVWFVAAGPLHSFNLADAPRGVVAWNNDLSSYFNGGVFVQHKTDPERVVIEWQTETYDEESLSVVNTFEVVLFKNSNIRIDYKTFNTAAGMDFGSGLAFGGGISLSLTSAVGNVFNLAGRSFLFTGSPKISVPSSFSYNFPSTFLGQDSAPLPFMVKNVGGGNLAIGNVGFRPDPSGLPPEFRISSDQCSGQNLEPMGSCIVDIVYHPTSAYKGITFVQVPSNDPIRPLAETFTQGTPITTAPVVSISSPASGTTTSSATPIVGYSVSDGSTVTVTLDGAVINKTSGQLLGPLEEGLHTLAIFSSTTGTTPVVSNFKVDLTPPVVTIVSPVTGISKNNIPFLNYTASEGSVVVNIDGFEVVKASGDILDILSDGSHTIEVRATDAGGNVGFQIVSLTIDTISPVLSVSTLPDQSSTKNKILNVAGTVQDANLAEVMINGQPVSLTDGTFSTAVSLNVGANVITVLALDLAGNLRTDTRTVFYDNTGPVIAVIHPVDGSYTTNAQVTVTGTVDTGATVTVNGVSASVINDTFSALVDLIQGVNTINIIAFDMYGNNSSQKRTITYDDIKPQLAITRPSQD